jgi:hypothetical protein
MEQQEGYLEQNIIELENPAENSSSILAELYTCKNFELCLIKYICGITSIIFVIAYSIAIKRVRKS